MQEFKISDQAKIVLHDDGHVEILKVIASEAAGGLHGYQLTMQLTKDEARAMFALDWFQDELLTSDEKARLITAKPMYEPDSVDADMAAQCPACHKHIKKAQLLKAPVGHIFCVLCRFEDCDCMMTREECICVD